SPARRHDVGTPTGFDRNFSTAPATSGSSCMSLQRPRPPFSIAMIVATLLIASGAGCHRPSLFVCDAFRLPGEPSTLEARFTECAMRREKRADMPQTAVAGLNVRFYVQNELLGEA